MSLTKKSFSPIIDLIGLREFSTELDKAIDLLMDKANSSVTNVQDLNSIHQFMFNSFDKIFGTNYANENLANFLRPGDSYFGPNHGEIWHALIHEVIKKDSYKEFKDINQSTKQSNLQTDIEEDIENAIEGLDHAVINQVGSQFLIRRIYQVPFSDYSFQSFESHLSKVESEVSALPEHLKSIATTVLAYVKARYNYEKKDYAKSLREIEGTYEPWEKSSAVNDLVRSICLSGKDYAISFYSKLLKSGKVKMAIPEETQRKFKFWILAVKQFIRKNI